MNKVILVGRITADPELRYTQSNIAYTRFTLAVNRNFKNESGETEADFISCVAWNKLAETISNYVKKGNRIGIAGRIQTGSYEKENGTKGYLTDVIISDLEFLESKNKEGRPAPEYTEGNPEAEDPFSGFGDSVQVTDDDLPF
jgi:single-strand DNA-binding protein